MAKDVRRLRPFETRFALLRVRRQRDMMPLQENNACEFASAEVAAELRRWLAHLGAERRMSPKTVEAYERDARQFLGFLAEHLGEQPTLKSLAAIEPRDVRAFMADRRIGGIGSPPPPPPPPRPPAPWRPPPRARAGHGARAARPP